MKEKLDLTFFALDHNNINRTSPFTHIMLEPITKTGSYVSEHEEPERAGDELSKSVLGSLIAQIEN